MRSKLLSEPHPAEYLGLFLATELNQMDLSLPVSVLTKAESCPFLSQPLQGLSTKLSPHLALELQPHVAMASFSHGCCRYEFKSSCLNSKCSWPLPSPQHDDGCFKSPPLSTNRRVNWGCRSKSDQPHQE